MLGLSDLRVVPATKHMESLHQRLKTEFRNGNSVQTLTQVLVLGDSDDHVVKRILALRDALRAQKIKLDKTYTLSSLGVLALLPTEMDTIVRDIDEAKTYLKGQKGFGFFSTVTRAELLLYAVAFVAGGYAEQLEEGIIAATLSTSITNIIIAQQTAMIAMLAATSSATATTTASS
jgi:hypothetical protein